MRRHLDTNVALASVVRHDEFDPNARRPVEVHFRTGPERTQLRVQRGGVLIGALVNYDHVLSHVERKAIEAKIHALETRPDILEATLIELSHGVAKLAASFPKEKRR